MKDPPNFAMPSTTVIGFAPPNLRSEGRGMYCSPSYLPWDRFQLFLKSSRKWIFGKDLQWLCQLAHSCQGTPVFLSSMAIVAIGKYYYVIGCTAAQGWLRIRLFWACLLKINFQNPWEHSLQIVIIGTKPYTKSSVFSAVDRYRCIMQPDKPHFSGCLALLISLLMTAVSILLCVPLYVSAEVRNA